MNILWNLKSIKDNVKEECEQSLKRIMKGN